MTLKTRKAFVVKASITKISTARTLDTVQADPKLNYLITFDNNH
jgi:hypothetical protein